ncbi:MAG: mandelate racemase/muconate lactonizing enzyme family protein [Acidobacteriota bacterium]|nr:MAG: mandelate racemase/muconate lactonizing enzyme family protein [Acidobacteriota bacterium]
MKRRHFLQSAIVMAGGSLGATSSVEGRGSDSTITRIRYYRSPNHNPTFNQNNGIVTVETAGGITGIGEGGSRDMIEQCGAMLIGLDAARTEHLWQMMYRGYFYPAGREKLHALGALDLALWDIRGKRLGVPVYELLGGLTRKFIECYSTAFPWQGSQRETAAACIEAGFKAYRVSAVDLGRGQPFDPRKAVRKTFESCQEVREGVGEGEWAIDYHTRLDFADAVRLSSLIEKLEPFFAEDLVRSENPGIYRTLRQQVKLPIAVGEQFGDRWDLNELVENDLIDYSRVTLPNCGGITEFLKISALCDTHYVGLVPHFTGAVATAALAHVCGIFPGPVMMEILRDKPRDEPHLPESFDFREGKVWPNDRPGLGVEFDPAKAELLLEITEASRPIPMLERTDGSFTNW